MREVTIRVRTHRQNEERERNDEDKVPVVVKIHQAANSNNFDEVEVESSKKLHACPDSSRPDSGVNFPEPRINLQNAS